MPASPDIIESSAEKLIRSVLDGAKKGNPLGLRLAIDALHHRSERMPIELRLPALRHAKDSANAHAMVLKAMADGELTPAEASGILTRLNRVVRVMKHCTPDAWYYPFSMERMQQILNPTVKWMIERLSSEW